MKDNMLKSIYIATTPYHVLISCNRCEMGDYIICAGQYEIDGMIEEMIAKTFGRTNCLIIDSFKNYKDNLFKLFFFQINIKHCLNKIRGIHFKRVLIFNDVDPVVQYCINIINSEKIVLIEEGIGLYRDTVRRNICFFKVLGKFFFGSAYENISRIGESGKVAQIECMFPEQLSLKQKMKKINKMSLANYDRLSKLIGINQIASDFWFIGQPVVEDGVLGEDEYINIINRLLSLTEKNIRWIIKPHPREEISKYEKIKNRKILIIENFQVPVELMLNSVGFTKIITLYSSAILNLKNIQNVTCISLLHVVCQKLVDYKIEELFQKNGIIIPDNWDDLKNKLKNDD